MAELVYALVLGTSGATLGSSSLPPGTGFYVILFFNIGLVAKWRERSEYDIPLRRGLDYYKKVI